MQELEKISDRDYRCPACGAKVRIKAPTTKRVVHACKVEPDLTCTHRGPVLREVPCKLCGAQQKTVAVYQCAIHSECTLTRTKSGTDFTCCLTCRDRAS